MDLRDRLDHFCRRLLSLLLPRDIFQLGLFGKSGEVENAYTENECHALSYSEREAEGVCAICTEPLCSGEVLRLPCSDKHVFHVACIRQWACVSPSCPLDRSVVPLEALVNLTAFNSVRLHASVFLKSLVLGASQYLFYTRLWFDFPINLTSIAISGCSSRWVERIDNSLFTRVAEDVTPLPMWSRPGVLMFGEIAFHVLLWTSYSSIGYSSRVLHYLLRCFCEKQGTKLCMLAIQWINVGYDYQESRQLLAKTKWVRVPEFPFILQSTKISEDVQACIQSCRHFFGRIRSKGDRHG